MRLADCVTYLKALREKQIKNAHQLNVELPMPQKKRKRLQQTRQHLAIEIRNRERDKQAFLNNLQANETNIILANMKAQYLTNASFHASDRTPSIPRDPAELSDSLPVPPNTAQSQYRRSSILSPEAAVFKPSYSSDPSTTAFKRLSMSSATATKAKELLRKRRFSIAEIAPILQRFSIDAQSRPELLPGQKWCKSTPQLKPHKDEGVQMSRLRTNSL